MRRSTRRSRCWPGRGREAARRRPEPRPDAELPARAAVGARRSLRAGARRDPPGGRRPRRRRDDPPVGPRAPRRYLPAVARRPPPRRPHGDALPRHGRRLARPRRPDRRAAGVRARARSRAAHEPPHDPGGGVLRLGLHDRARAGRAAPRDPVPGAGRRERRSVEVAHRDGDFAVVCVARNGDRVAVGGVAATPVLWAGGERRPQSATCSPRPATSAAIAERLVAE